MIDIYYTLQAIFPKVYQTVDHNSQAADFIYEQIFQYLSIDSLFYQQKQQRQSIKRSLAKLTKDLHKENKQNSKRKSKDQQIQQQGSYIKFMCQFGCLLLIKNKKIYKTIDVYVIYPNEWQQVCYIYNKQEIYYCEPQSLQTINIEKFISQQEIDDFMKRFQAQLTKQLKKQQELQSRIAASRNLQNLQQYKSNSSLFQNKYTINIVQRTVRQTKSQLQQKNKQEIANSNRYPQILQNVDFNKHNSNTIWYVIQAAITQSIAMFKGNVENIPKMKRKKKTNAMIKKNQKVQIIKDKLIIGFKLFVLEKMIKTILQIDFNQTVVHSQRKDIINYKHCLNEIIYSYKEYQKTYSSKDNVNFAKKIKQLELNLFDLNGYQLTTNIDQIDKEQLIQINQNEQPLILKPIKYEESTKKVGQIKIKQLDCFISRTNPFQRLLNIYNQNIIKQNIKNNAQMKQLFLNHWVLLVEKTIFNLAKDIDKYYFHVLDINMRQIQCQFGAPFICKLVIKYQQVINLNKTYYGMGIEAQALSHIELVKTICSVVVFQIIKYKRKNMKSNLDSYIVPLNIQQLYSNFISHNHSARRAMGFIYSYYQKRKINKPIFKLDGTSNSFYDFGVLVAQQSRNAQGWLAYMANIKKIPTKRQIKSSFPINQSDQKVLAFLHNIPSDILGLMKMVMLSQNPKVKVHKKQLQKNNLQLINSVSKFQNEQLKVTIYVRSQNDLCHLSSNYSQIKILFNDCQKGEQLDLNNDHLKFTKNYDELKQQNQEKTQIQQLQDSLITQVSQQKQILELLQRIFQNKIIIDCQNYKEILEEEKILQINRQLNTLKKQQKDYIHLFRKLLKLCFKTQGDSETKFYPIYAPLIGYLIQQYLQNIQVDPAVAQNISMIIFKLGNKCWQQFEKGQKQLIQNPSLNIRQKQRFLVIAAICCFRQSTLCQLNNKQQFELLIKLLFQLRILNIFQDLQQKQGNKRKFNKLSSYCIHRVIFSNIQAISNFLQQNNYFLNQILKKLDKNFHNSVKWQKVDVYELKGIQKQNNDIYQIDLYRGRIYKNGKQLGISDQRIRENNNFINIFGLNRHFQISRNNQANYFRAHKDFSQNFKLNQQKYEAYFQFSEEADSIRYLINRKDLQQNQQPQIWQLFPKQILTKSRIHFPAIFLQDYSAWYCKQKGCIIFRKTKYQNIYDIGLVIHLIENCQTNFSIKKALRIVFHKGYQNQNLQQICNISNIDYQQIILRQKNIPLSDIEPFNLLSKLDDPKFVFQLKKQKTNEIFYLLYRYQLKFKLQKGKLFSVNHPGYFIDKSYNKTQGNIYEQLIPCLVLKKDDNKVNPNNSHKRIIIVSDGRILDDIQIIKPKFANEYIKSFKYIIHDFFGDIRGETRESQLQMVAILLSFQDNLKIKGIQMTPLQYAINIFKTCFSNQPLSKKEVSKLQNIIQLADTQIFSSNEMLLLCQILWKCCNILNNVLPFENQSYHILNNQNYIQKIKHNFRIEHSNRKDVQNKRIHYRKKIDPKMLKFIGIYIVQQDRQYNKSYRKNYWPGINQQKFDNITNVFHYIKQKYQQICDKYESSFRQDFLKYNQECQQVAKYILEQQQKQEKELIVNFPQNIFNYILTNNNSQMMKQMADQFLSSRSNFIQQQLRLKKFQILYHLNGEYKIQLMQKLIADSTKCIDKISQQLKLLKQNYESHPDIISGFRPTLSQPFFTRILCYQKQIYNYFPQIQQYDAKRLRQIIKIWMDLQTRRACFQRIIILLKHQKIDIVELFRQVGSPRRQIYNQNSWICFQAEIKIQIWLQQVQTYKNLMDNIQKKPFCQLNMGEGKTQVIIPLMILQNIFKYDPAIPRINLLSTLFQETRANMFKFLSTTGFQIPCFLFPFNRKVSLNKQNQSKIQDLMDCFSSKAYILVNRESRISQILKQKQAKIKQNCVTSISLFNLPIFDIVDEVDDFMVPNRSYIYPVGKPLQLSTSQTRFQILRQLIEKLLLVCLKQLFKQQMIISDNYTKDRIFQLINNGEFPDGLRFKVENFPQQNIERWKRQITLAVLQDKDNQYQQLIQRLNQKQLNKIVEYCVFPQKKFDTLPKKISIAFLDQIFILRGALAFGIFQYSFQKRYGVDYGLSSLQHSKRISVPFQAAGIPSRTSQFSNTQLSIIFSYISYYSKGLSFQEYKTCIEKLLNLELTARQAQLCRWVQIINAEQKKNIIIQNRQKIKINLLEVYQIFRKNRKTIAFFLINCIFEKDLKQYKQIVYSSTFDLANVKKLIGFSGTLGNHWVLPNNIKLISCNLPTDAKMIYSATKFTKQICIIQQDHNRPLWQSFIEQALIKKSGCFLDICGLCGVKDFKQQIIPWIANNAYFNTQQFTGISFCDPYGKWQVYDIQSRFYIERGTSIPDHSTFVLFDEARTRGADIKMDIDVIATLALSSNTSKDKIMQAIGRLRRLGKNQSIIVLTTYEILSNVSNFPKNKYQIQERLSESSSQQIMQLILAQSCRNSVNDNQNILPHLSVVGCKFIHSEVNNNINHQQMKNSIEQKYKKSFQRQTVAEISKIQKKKRSSYQLQHKNSKKLYHKLQKYGKKVKNILIFLNDICESQIEKQENLKHQSGEQHQNKQYDQQKQQQQLQKSESQYDSYD